MIQHVNIGPWKDTLPTGGIKRYFSRTHSGDWSWIKILIEAESSAYSKVYMGGMEVKEKFQ